VIKVWLWQYFDTMMAISNAYSLKHKNLINA